MKPPFTITSEILNLCSEITLLLGRYEGLSLPVPQPELRKHARVASIQSSLAIEGNTLTIEQVTDVINHKRVSGPPEDILEVKNAIAAYDQIDQYEPDNLDSLLRAHKILMDGLVKDAGKLRRTNVGVRAGSRIVHMAPPHARVPELMDNLFTFLKNEKDLHPLIKSSVFHYELEFIHPFSDGNGRIGRLWQSVILYNYRKIFEYIPIETVIRRRQMEYYDALQMSTQEGRSTGFIKFMLETIRQAMVDFSREIKPVRQLSTLRLKMARDRFGQRAFTRKDYLEVHKNISTATASRDLAIAVTDKILARKGEKATTEYKFL